MPPESASRAATVRLRKGRFVMIVVPLSNS
jgi:hypothetical protein